MAKTGGFIKIFRGLRFSNIWDSDRGPFSDGQAWVDLLLRANHAPKTIRVSRKRVSVPAGSFVASVRKLGEAWKWSNGKVLRFLRELEEDDRLVRKVDRGTEHGYTMISICNWADYQIREESDGTRNDTPTERGRNTDGTRTGHKQEREEVKEGGELSPVPPEDDPFLEAKENGDVLDDWITRSTWANREDLAERRVEAEGCLRLYNDLKGSSVALTSKLFRQYVALWDLWEDPMKILEAVKGLFCDPDQWATKRNLGPEFAWKDAEIAERYVAHARDGWESGGWEKLLSMKKEKARRER